MTNCELASDIIWFIISTFVLMKIKINKACDPDRVKSVVLKACHRQLAPIYTYIFNISLTEKIIPLIWKTSEISPIPKKSKVTTFNDLRPVALTSIVFKCFEKIVLSHLLDDVILHLDTYQFAYKAGRNIEDAVLIFTNSISETY